MAVKVYIDGVLYDPEHAVVSVFDRGFLYGDSVYEVMRTSAGVPVDEAPHLARLADSAAAIALCPPSVEYLRAAIRESLAAADNDESYIRVVVTRGGGEIGLDMALADEPRLIIIIKPLTRPAPELYQRGIALAIVHRQRTSRQSMDPRIKSGNYLNNIMALHEARRVGADEALMCDAAGRVAEGTTSNVFVVNGGGLITPTLDIGLLPGITRRRVIELARRDGMDVVEGVLTPEQVRSADEAFITSSIRGVLPVATVDGAPLACPAAGPVTRRIMTLYDDFLAEQARA
ncbi:aminotransferase class IV [Haliangium sp.]|uniref:aminotransferase class IV n=1 Tax=Haliangium sp. TaxID=2663208 RepID=UPI003D12C825